MIRNGIIYDKDGIIVHINTTIPYPSYNLGIQTYLYMAECTDVRGHESFTMSTLDYTKEVETKVVEMLVGFMENNRRIYMEVR